MSAIREMISDQIKTAMKSKNTERLATLRLIKAEIIKKETEKAATELNEEGLIKLLNTMRKQRQDSIEAFEKGGRKELADKERAEIVVIESFLPQALSDEELETMVKAVLAELGIADAKQMGLAVKEVMARAAGRADGRRVSGAVKALLG